MSDSCEFQQAVVLRPDDDVAVAVKPLKAGETIPVDGVEVTLRQDVPPGHKFALRAAAEDAPIHKYGQIIGFATRDVAVGDHVHTHNLAVKPISFDYEYSTAVPEVAYVPESERATFQGISRPNRQVATRNYLAVVSTVNCSASVSRYIAERFRGEALKAFPNIDGVVAFTHKAGCAMNINGADLALLERTLAGCARHPNVAGYLLCGLGCEVNQASAMIEHTGLTSLTEPTQLPKVVTIQQEGGVRRAVEAGVREIERLLPRANDVQRTTHSAAELIVGNECGGSDAYSGITGNPAVGAMVDEVVRHGGTGIIAETPETYGAEHLLTRRAVTPEVGKKLVALMRWWEDYTARNGAEIDNNPAPGNKAGGLTTIYEKSLGAMAKGGSGPLADVLQYGERVKTPGFLFMDSPGYDPVSITGLVASGANVVTFTTGRGSCYGCKPVPSLKIATNSFLYEHMNEDMDINAGVILSGVSIEDVGHLIFEKTLAVASGEKTKSELNGMGDEEFNPWIIGATL